MDKGFVRMWQEAAESDWYWQYEELCEDDPDAAEAMWNDMRIVSMANERLERSPNISMGQAILDAMTIICLECTAKCEHSQQ